MTSTQWRLAARPVGLPKPSDFRMTHDPVPAPAAGEVQVEVLYVSLDPYMRGRMNDAKSYAAALSLGDVVGAIGAFPDAFLRLFDGRNTGKLMLKVAG